MTERVVYTPEAAEDIAASYDWYERREPGLGEEFLRSVEACVSRIHRQPLIYPPVFDEFRRAILKRFPFEVFYEAGAGQITVHAVFHFSREPQRWRSRLERRKE